MSAFWRKAQFRASGRGGTRRGAVRRDRLSPCPCRPTRSFSSTSAIRSSIRAAPARRLLRSAVPGRARAARRLSRARRGDRRASRTRPRRPPRSWCSAIRWPTGWPTVSRTRCRDARNRRRPQAQGLLRPDPLRSRAERAGLVAGRARSDRGREAEGRHHDDRPEGPSGDPRATMPPADQDRPKRGDRQAGRAEARRTEAGRRSKAGASKAGGRNLRTADAGDADDEQTPNIAAPEPQRAARPRSPAARIPHRKMGRALRQAHRRHDRGAEDRRTCRCSGSACRRSAARSRPPTCSISTSSIARAPRRPASSMSMSGTASSTSSGRFTTQGPDFEGQMRRLRTGDGVHFTKSGARKLAHYVERELRRMLSAALPVALPAPEPAQPPPAHRRSPARRLRVRSPVPVLLLTQQPTKPDELLGGSANRAPARGRSGRDAACWSRARRSPPPPAAPTISPGRRGVPNRRCSEPAAAERRRRSRSPERCRRFRCRSGRPGGPARPGRHSPSRPAQRACVAGQTPPPAAASSRRAHGACRRRRPFGRSARLLRIIRGSSYATVGSHRGSVVDPIRNLSIAWAHWRPSRIAHTTSDWPRRMSPAANTFGSRGLVIVGRP